MITVQLRLYEELNRVLPPQKRKRIFQWRLTSDSCLRDLVYSLGLELEDIDLALVNSGSASFDYQLQDSDLVSLYPEFESMDVSSVCRLRWTPLRNTKFVAEPSLQELAAHLREQGYDCACTNVTVEELARISKEQKRILLTTTPGLEHFHDLQRCICIRSKQPQKQWEEIKTRLQLE